jgi:hypothetical protein
MELHHMTLNNTTPNPSSNSPTKSYYVVETTGKQRRYVRACYNTLEEAEQHKRRIKARWQPTIKLVYGGPFTSFLTYVPPPPGRKDKAALWRIVGAFLAQLEEAEKSEQHSTPSE